ncbi:glycosyltransferase [Chryseobacterium foetidum]|uniref:glycosyltransferase n=1 Tax=Chryseobacterium foetidum TaxID=2951057 RepID=UPI0021CA2811|nr:glycosyltransferase [Chryseobacterium foetidum]
MITYNHVNYISQCIDGILMQQTNFDFEIVIGDDLSTDGTRELLQKYALQYPNLIKLNLREKRGIGIPGKENFVSTLNMCDGEYISLCDGDDYWTDPLKLQKQITFLEDNRDFSVCFHNIEEVDVEGKTRHERILKSESSEKVYTIEDLSKVNFIHTPSVVFRKNYSRLPEFFEFCPIGDYPLHLINAQYGKIKYFPEKMACYRIGSGIWSKQDVKTQILKTVYTITYLIMYFKNNAVVKQNLENQVRLLLEEATVTKKIILDADYRDLHLISKKMYIGHILQLLKIKIFSKIWKTN